MKSITLSSNKVAIVDDEDYEFLTQWKWCFDGKYAMRNQWISETKNEHIYMHALIMNTPKGMITDHINRDPLDNRRSNLRIVTQKDNSRNRTKNKNNTSGYRGVIFMRHTKKWNAHIMVNRKNISLGCYVDPIEAAKAYDKAAKSYFGIYATLNFVEEL